MHLTDEELERILREIARAAVEEMERGADRPPQGTGAGGTLPQQPQEERDVEHPDQTKVHRFGGPGRVSPLRPFWLCWGSQ